MPSSSGPFANNAYTAALRIEDDGQARVQLSQFEDLVRGTGERASRAMQRAGQDARDAFNFAPGTRQVQDFGRAIDGIARKLAQFRNDPLNLGAQLEGLRGAPIQSVIGPQLQAQRQLLEQSRRELQTDINAMAALAEQRQRILAELAAGPRQLATVGIDPRGAAEAAAAARQLANAQEQVALAAERSAASSAKATIHERALAQSAREAATALAAEASRLEGLSLAHAKAAQTASAAGQTLVQSSDLVVNGVRNQRFATLQASQQFQDFFIQIQGGTNPMVAFSQQASQLAFVMAGAGGETGKFAAFMGGGWGTLIFAGISVLSLLGASLFKTKDATVDAKKAADDYTKAIDQQTDALQRNIRTQEQQLQLSASNAQVAVSRTRIERDAARVQVASEQRNLQRVRALPIDQENPAAHAAAVAAALEKVEAAENNLAAATSRLATMERKLRLERIPLIEREREVAALGAQGKALNDLENQMGLLKLQFENGLISEQKFRAEGDRLQPRINAAKDAIKELGQQAREDIPTYSQLAKVLREAFPGTRITSTVRTRERNRQVGGAASSYHLTGRAVDFTPPPGITKEDIRQAFAARGVNLTELLGPGDLGGRHKGFHIALAQGKTALEDFAAGAREAEEAEREFEQAQEQLIGSLQSLVGSFDFLETVPGTWKKITPAMREASEAAQQFADAQKAINDAVEAGVLARAEADKQLAAVDRAIGVNAAGKRAITAAEKEQPFNEFARALEEQRAIQGALAQGRQREADILEETFRIQDQLKVSMEDARKEAERIVDARHADARAADLVNQKIDAQVDAARQLQGAFENFLEDPFSKGSLKEFSDSISGIRRQRIARQLSIELLGDLGKDTEDRLTRSARAHEDAATQLKEAATALKSAATARTGPTVGQVATTPTAFGLGGGAQTVGGGGTGIEVGPGGEIIITGRRTSTIASQGTNKIVSTIKNSNLTLADRITGFADRFELPLTLLAGAVGGKAGNAINAFQNIKVFKSLGDSIAKSVGGTLGKTLGGAVGGVGTGLFADSIVKLLGGKGSSTGGAIGGAIGGAVFGPVGAFVGGLLGSFVGGLFKKTPKASTTIFGAETGGFASTTSGNSAQLKRESDRLGTAVMSSMEQLAASLGTIVDAAAGSVSIGIRDGKFRVDPYGAGRTKGAGVLKFGEDQQAAVEAAMRDLISDGVLGPIRESTKKILLAGGDFQRAISKAVKFENIFIRLKEHTDPVGAAIDRINLEFTDLRRIAAEAGASLTELSQLEQLYAIERAEAVKSAAKDMSSALQDLLEDLTFKEDTGLSLRTRQRNAKSVFDPLAAQVQAGNVVDQDAFAEAARALLEIEREIYGSTAQYFSTLRGITLLTQQAITNAGGSPNVVAFPTSGGTTTSASGYAIPGAAGTPTAATPQAAAQADFLAAATYITTAIATQTTNLINHFTPLIITDSKLVTAIQTAMLGLTNKGGVFGLRDPREVAREADRAQNTLISDLLVTMVENLVAARTEQDPEEVTTALQRVTELLEEGNLIAAGGFTEVSRNLSPTHQAAPTPFSGPNIFRSGSGF